MSLETAALVLREIPTRDVDRSTPLWSTSPIMYRIPVPATTVVNIDVDDAQLTTK